MTVATEFIKLSTKGNADVHDITPKVKSFLKNLDIRSGIVNINVCGSTGALTTCEFEPGLVQDIKEIFDKLIPAGRYHHDQAWPIGSLREGNGNGHSHLRALLVGPSLTLPFKDKELILGTWQQIIFIDFDNRPRHRELVVQFLGE